MAEYNASSMEGKKGKKKSDRSAKVVNYSPAAAPGAWYEQSSKNKNMKGEQLG